MKLLVRELDSASVYQTIVPLRNTIVEAIRPHLLKYSNPSGSLKLQIQNEAGLKITESQTVAISSISDGTYFHGKVRFYIDAHLKANTTYRVALIGVGYTFSESAYIGWCNSFDLKSYPSNYTPSEGYHSPLALEVFERKKV